MVNYDDLIYLMINHSLKFFKVSNLKAIIAEGKAKFHLDGKEKIIGKFTSLYCPRIPLMGSVMPVIKKYHTEYMRE
jgi:hypothetical protein